MSGSRKLHETTRLSILCDWVCGEKAEVIALTYKVSRNCARRIAASFGIPPRPRNNHYRYVMKAGKWR